MDSINIFSTQWNILPSSSAPSLYSLWLGVSGAIKVFIPLDSLPSFLQRFPILIFQIKYFSITIFILLTYAMLIFNWSHLGLLLLLVLAICCQCEAWLPWWTIPPHERVGYSPAPALATPANPVVTPAMFEEPLSVVPKSSNPLLALYSEAPTKTVLTLFWSSFFASLLISYTFSL